MRKRHTLPACLVFCAFGLIVCPASGQRVPWFELTPPCQIDPRTVGGVSLAGVSDVDGDERGDVVVGVCIDSTGAEKAGRVYVYSGATGRLLHTLTSSNERKEGLFGSKQLADI